jgi:hypothetical protein
MTEILSLGQLTDAGKAFLMIEQEVSEQHHRRLSRYDN